MSPLSSIHLCSTRYQVTAFPTVPPVIQQLANSPKVTKEHLKSVTGVYSGAAHLPPAVANRLIAKTGGGLEVGNGYGLTEMVRPFPFPVLFPLKDF